MESLERKIKETLASTTYNESDYFTAFGFRNFNSLQKSDIEKIYVGHEDEIIKIVNHAKTVFKQKSLTRRIAIIAPSGSGKTTFDRIIDIMLNKFRGFLDINATFEFHVKYTPRSLLREQLRIVRRIKNAIIFIDDMHEAFIDDNNKDDDIKKAVLTMFNEKVEGGLILTTWLPVGWAQAVSQMPELINLFDEIITLQPLNTQESKKMLKLRFEHLSLKERENFEPFTEQQINYAIQLSEGNPEILLRIIMNAMRLANEDKSKNIKTEHIDKIVKKYGKTVDINNPNMPDALRSTLRACLFQISITAHSIASIQKQPSSRANYSIYLNKMTMEPYNFLDVCSRCIHSKKVDKRKLVFHVKPFVRFSMEMQLMNEIESKYCHKN